MNITKYIYLLSIFCLLGFTTGCLGSLQDVDIPLAISQTQTAIVAVKPVNLPTQTAAATLAVPQYGKNTQSYESYGISLNFDTSIIRNIQPEVLPSTETWRPFHLQNPAQPAQGISGGVPDYFKFTLEEVQPVANRIQPTLFVRPVKNTDGQYYPALVNDSALTQELEKLQARIKEHAVQDRFFDGTRLEIQRQYINFKNGKGIRYVTAVPGNDKPGEINPQNMVYVFEGLTDDGRYYTELSLWAGFQGLKEYTIAPQDQTRYAEDQQAYSEYISKIDWQMRMLEAPDFIPDLSQLDAMINSLSINPVIAAPTQGSSTSAGAADLGLGDPTFSDTFEKTPSYLFIGQDSYTKTEVKDGSVIMSSLNEGSDRWRIVELYPLGDVYVQMVVRNGDVCTGKDGFGWIMRATPMGAVYNSGYVFVVACDGTYRIYRLDRDRYYEIRNWKANPYILAGPGRTNKIGIMAKGNTFALYVNSSLIDQFQDDMFAMGSFGPLISSPDDADYKYYIDELAFWNLYQKVVAMPTPTTVESSMYVPLELTQCETLQMEIAKIIDVTGTRVEYPFLDPLDENARGKACHIEYSAPGEKITSMDQLRSGLAAFEKLGWTPEPKYDALGADGEQHGYRKPNQTIALVSLKWQTAEGVTCPTETPMEACKTQLAPSQIVYILSVDAAQRSFSTPTSTP